MLFLGPKYENSLGSFSCLGLWIKISLYCNFVYFNSYSDNQTCIVSNMDFYNTWTKAESVSGVVTYYRYRQGNIVTKLLHAKFSLCCFLFSLISFMFLLKRKSWRRHLNRVWRANPFFQGTVLQTCNRMSFFYKPFTFCFPDLYVLKTYVLHLWEVEFSFLNN